MTKSIFPFYLTDSDSSDLFRLYVRGNREFLNETYGHRCFTGNPNVTKLWSYYSVEAVVTDANTIKFITYGMRSFSEGGIGDMQEKIIVTYPDDTLTTYIKAEQRRIATREYNAREIIRIAEERTVAIDLIFLELFPSEAPK